MRVTEIRCRQFRNLEDLTLSAHPVMNLIYGQNAQGKTNLLEALWLFTGQKSFRGAHDRQMIQAGTDAAELALGFDDGRREQKATLRIAEKQRIATVNGVKLDSASALAGRFYAVVFEPSHLSIAKDGPQMRRRFLDAAISQISPSYTEYLAQYEKALEQRNALIRDIRRFPSLDGTLDVWDLQLAKLCTLLTIYRGAYIERLKQKAAQIYGGFSGETLTVRYASGSFDRPEEIKNYTDRNIELFYNRLKSSFEQDVKLKFTSVGAHRDDLDLLVDGLLLREFGSQGQKRSVVLALKLAEAMLLQEAVKERPVILFDDVLSELDAKRQSYLLNELEAFQVFITCCDRANTDRLLQGSVFQIENGAIKR